MADKITPRGEDYSRWYTDIIQQAELADYAPVRGCMVIRPYGYTLWENVVQGLDSRFKATGHVNAYFPLFIPYSFLAKEAEHIEGFAPQLAVVTHGGGKELEEPLVVRPTSETVIGHMYAQWIRSYRDLPLLINQWSNVVRWELRTRLFLRTMEFLWQEGHTAHATYDEAQAETLQMLEVYRDFTENDAAIPVICGRKSESEKFAGALASYSIEAMMGDKRALQAGTSHNLGQNFAKAFDIRYLDRDNKLQYCWTTSWGLSTRMIGAIVMVHGDDQGLKLPPELAPIQVVVVPIYKNDQEKSQVMEAVGKVPAALPRSVRLKVDDREEVSPGYKFNDWEMRGVPLRIELGPKDAAKGQVVLARRDVPGKAGKSVAGMERLATQVQEMLAAIQGNLFAMALKFREENTRQVATFAELKTAVEEGFAVAWWCGARECEDKIQKETTATCRNIPLDQSGGKGVCVVCGKEAVEQAVFARAY
jgi:prolyl-tRNA synthetase